MARRPRLKYRTVRHRAAMAYAQRRPTRADRAYLARIMEDAQ